MLDGDGGFALPLSTIAARWMRRHTAEAGVLESGRAAVCVLTQKPWASLGWVVIEARRFQPCLGNSCRPTHIPHELPLRTHQTSLTFTVRCCAAERYAAKSASSTRTPSATVTSAGRFRSNESMKTVWSDGAGWGGVNQAGPPDLR